MKLLCIIFLVVETYLLLVFDCLQCYWCLSLHMTQIYVLIKTSNRPNICLFIILLHVVYEAHRTDMAVASSYGSHNLRDLAHSLRQHTHTYLPNITALGLESRV